jgi:hypothetical protein
MATKYRATITLNCWKQHICAGCGGAFRYRFRRKVQGEASTKEAAERSAQLSAVTTLKSEVDAHPCPTCGVYQLDMIGSRRAFRHGLLTFLAALAFIALLFPVYTYDLLAPHVIIWLAAGIGAVTLLLHLFISFSNPNRNLSANRSRAELAMNRGHLEQVAAGRSEEPTVPNSEPTRKHHVLFVVMLLGVALLAAAELIRMAREWPLNPGWAPEVVGPGDEAKFVFDDSFRSVEGLWRGDPNVEVLNGKELGQDLTALHAESNSASWGSSISTEGNKSWHPWIKVEVPGSPSVAGKELRLHLTLHTTHPADKVLGFDEEAKTVEATNTLRVADTGGAGATYRAAWWGGLIGGTLCLTIVGIMLARAENGRRSQALPTTVEAIG